ncbi:DinB family protein [Cloacibacterium normanense]|jgi:uncharacterized damage-inducible protein DinB|uniref:DinB family protein n=1 Tax=Cloacibacterium normanense TaxID=237258 RepID=A0A1E5UCI4_9FLAO|nr:DinB family protein [Cloacibacterium normanense]AZI70449.1 damage-inducible protein DinB [Cloacibacterium normanense]OEL10570.1 dinB family protein [Cloacibacterium normanense]SDO28137.1 Uncharacterized damage-inducible protein DinB (forms a four-helix bundle) [Cloacibacterium normanense]
MDTLSQLRQELEQEYQTTKKFFERFPEGKNDYAPHEKSMKMMPLSTHIAEVFGWPDFIVKTSVLDFAAGDYQPTFLETREQLLQKLEEDYQKSKATLHEISEDKLNERWQMKMGEQVLADWDKYGAIRHSLNQATHHRAQLGVYYRLLDIPVPGSYGPSADEQEM